MRVRLASWLKRLAGGQAGGSQAVTWTGDYHSWEEARGAGSGYDHPLILQRVREAAREVRSGRAAFERDAVVFPREEFNWPLIAQLFQVAARSDGRLDVLDFGGSLGSVYYQHRRLLTELRSVSWRVVEQPAFVSAGREEFEDGRLTFHESIEAAMQSQQPNTVLVSSVLQYVQDPRWLLDALAACAAPFLLLDRTSVALEGPRRLTLQRTPEWIYEASYPAWFLDWDELLASLQPRYRLVCWFRSAPDPPSARIEGGQLVGWRGALFEHVHPSPSPRVSPT